MKKIASIIMTLLVMLCSTVGVFGYMDDYVEDETKDEISYPEWLINSDYKEEEKEYIVSMIAPGWLEHFAFDEEGIVKAIQKRADYFGTTFEEMKAYLQDEAEMRDATIGYEIEDGSVAVVPNRCITVNLAPGFCDYYAELDPEEVFPGIEIEKVFYLNSRRLSSDRTYPRDYNPELYAMTVELKLKNGGIDVLNDALEKLYSLDYVKDAFMGRHILGIKPDIDDRNSSVKLNAKDVTALMKYLVGGNVKIDVEKADFNSDGKLNARDVLAMMKTIIEG